MSKTTADYMIERIHEWGINRIYGFPGDGINGIMGALDRNSDKVRFVQSRHEELSAFMACAHAKFTGQVGICLATSGPGAIHLLNGLYDAKKDHVPVVAIVGQQKRMSLGGDYQQEVDLSHLFSDVSPHYCHMASEPSQVRTLIDQAIRIAFAERTVTTVILPNDLQEENYQEAPRKHGATYTGTGYARPNIVPRQEHLERAADILNEGKKVAILVGAGALNAQQEVDEVAEKLGAGVAKALLGKAVVADEAPYCTGAIGLLGTRPSWEMMNRCDTLFMIGTSFPYAEFLPEEGSARGVQIDVKSRMLNLRYPMEMPLHGDAKQTLQALLPLLQHKTERTWRKRIEEWNAEWWKLMEERANMQADPINPQKICWDLSPKLPDNAIITSDSGSAANWFARDLKIRPPMMASLSGGLATMCPGVPYALAAKFCHPDRPAIALVGDGAMQMLGNNGLISIGEYYHEWSDPRLVIAVFNNGDLNQVTWEQRVMAGDKRFDTSQDVPAFDFAAYARLCGLEGIRIENPDDVSSAWDHALAANKPVVLDFLTDPAVPPLPPHIKFEQARKYLKSMLKGDSETRETFKQSIKQMAPGFLPGKSKKE